VAPVKRSKPAPAPVESPEHLRAIKAGSGLAAAVVAFNAASAESTKHPRSGAAREAVKVAEIALGKAKARAKAAKAAELLRDGPTTPASAPSAKEARRLAEVQADIIARKAEDKAKARKLAPAPATKPVMDRATKAKLYRYIDAKIAEDADEIVDISILWESIPARYEECAEMTTLRSFTALLRELGFTLNPKEEAPAKPARKSKPAPVEDEGDDDDDDDEPAPRRKSKPAPAPAPRRARR
jgi:hypothetical protein